MDKHKKGKIRVKIEKRAGRLERKALEVAFSVCLSNSPDLVCLGE
jgi:hypothetical protein